MKTNYTILNRANNLIVIKEDKQMVKKHMKRYPTSLVISEMKLKAQLDTLTYLS